MKFPTVFFHPNFSNILIFSTQNNGDFMGLNQIYPAHCGKHVCPVVSAKKTAEWGGDVWQLAPLAILRPHESHK